MNKSLNSIMNQMARQETALGFVKPRTHKNLQPLEELDAFVLLDDVLEDLHKQYLDAKAQYKELVSLSGADDAMATVALDMQDSAWCAMQTRYIELRAERKMMAQAQDMIRRRTRQIDELKERIEHSYKQKQARDFMNYLKIMKVMKEKNKIPQIFEWLILFLIFRIDVFSQSQQKNNYHHAMPIAV